MPIILGYLATTAGRWVVLCGMVLLTWFGFARHYEKKGAERVTAQIEEATNEAVSNANSAGSKSSNPKSRGVRSPYYRD